ncbi:hypothetical protein L218DRAFT_619251 [Marasmius fiardii PR-910]|nr:hypothetical protein L218DRAFT_619251 [Marasmius fiardii PR-910]
MSASVDSTWISAFQSNLKISDNPIPNPSTSHPAENVTETPTSIGQMSSFVLLVAGLEKKFHHSDTPIIFDDIDATFGGSQTRVPIASGASFSVERASWKTRGTNKDMSKWGEHVALKCVRQRCTGNWKHILLEMRALLHEPIRYHPNIVRMIGVSWGAAYDSGTSFPVLVLELADHGTLEHLQINEPQLSFEVKKKLCYDVSKGLSILHACGIVHGDLKHENVLVFKDKRKDAVVPYIAKLGDFGGSVMDLEKEGSTLHMRTPPYDAPEARNRRLDADGIKRTDVYSLGILVWRTLFNGRAILSELVADNGEKLTSAQVDEFKGSEAFLAFAKEAVRAYCSDIDGGGLELIDFVLDNTIQLSPQKRNLVNAVAGLQAKSIPEISELIDKAAEDNKKREREYSERKPGWRGITSDGLGIFMAKTAEKPGSYDFQEAGPGSRPELDPPNPAELLFDPQRLKRILSWDIQKEIFNDLIAVANAKSNQHATQMTSVSAAFYLFQCYCHELGTRWDPVQACYWLKQAALPDEDCKEGYLAQAWCWRVHRALGVDLDVDRSSIQSRIPYAILRGHRKCIQDAMTILESLDDPEERTLWQNNIASRPAYLNSYMGAVGMPYFAHWKLRRPYDLANLDALDGVIREEFQSRGVTSIDDIFVNHRGDGLLHYAAAVGNYNALQHLVTKYKPNIDLPDQYGYETPLLCACKGGHLACALYLLDQGASPDGSQLAEEVPLYWLTSFSEVDMPVIAERLVHAGAKISNAGHPSKRASRQRRFPVIWADMEEQFLLPVSPLSRAVMMENMSGVRTLLALGADPMEKYEERSSICPVVLAAVLSLPEMLQILLSHLDGSSATPVVIFDEIEMLQVALDLKATIHDPMTLQSRLIRLGESYQSAVDDTLQILHDRHKACSGTGGSESITSNSAVELIIRLVKLGREDLIRSLLKLGHSIRGHTGPLVEAVRMNHESIFRLLLDHGADVHGKIMTPPGTPEVNLLQIFAEGHPTSRRGLSIAEYLIKEGLPVNPPENGARSPFMFAVLKQDFELADLFLQHGADMNFHFSAPQKLTLLGDVAFHPMARNVESLKYLLNVDDQGKSLAGTSESRVRGEELPNFVAGKDLGWTALHYVCNRVSRTDLEQQAVAKMVRLILSVKAYRDAVNNPSPELAPAWLNATVCANLEAISELLEMGVDVDRSYNGATPLMLTMAILQAYPNMIVDGMKYVLGDDNVSQQRGWRRYTLIGTLLNSRSSGQSSSTGTGN